MVVFLQLMYEIKVLTPLFTGGVNRTHIRVREEGLFGSLKYLAKMTLRSLSIPTCTVENCCKLPTDRIDSICALCLLFGTIGWRGIFSLNVAEEGHTSITGGFYTINYGKKKREIVKGFLGKLLLTLTFDDTKLHIISRKLGEDVTTALLSTIRLVLERLLEYVAIGARTARGYGAVSRLSYTYTGSLRDIDTLDIVKTLKSSLTPKNEVYEPSFCGTRFYKIRFSLEGNNYESFLESLSSMTNFRVFVAFGDDYNKIKHIQEFLPTSPLLREILRLEESIPNVILGDRDLGSQLFITNAYRRDDHFEFRVWSLHKDGDSIRKIISIICRSLQNAGAHVIEVTQKSLEEILTHGRGRIR